MLNMLYLQDIVGVPSVLAVAWTLCLEVQFYLIVVIVALTAGRLGRTLVARTRMQVGVMLALTASSLALALFGVSTGPWCWVPLDVRRRHGAGMVRDGHRPRVGRRCGLRNADRVGCQYEPRQPRGPVGWAWFAIGTAMLVGVLAVAGWLERSPWSRRCCTSVASPIRSISPIFPS